MPERPLPYRPPELEEPEESSSFEHGRGREEPVSSREVHRRGQVVEAVPERVAEIEEKQRLEQLLEGIVGRYNRLSQIDAFLVAVDVHIETTYEGQSIKLRLLNAVVEFRREADATAQPYLADSTNTLFKTPQFQKDFEKIEEIQEGLDGLMEQMESILEGLEQAEGKEHIDIPPEIKALFEAPSSSAESLAPRVENTSGVVSDGRDDPSEEFGDAPRRPYASFGNEELQSLWGGMRNFPMEKVRAVEDSLKQWQEFDGVIQKYGSMARFEEDLGRRGLGDKYRETLALANQAGRNLGRLAEVKKRLEENGELDTADAGFLKVMFFGYHELLVVGEGIAHEREVEGEKIAAEDAARQSAERETKERAPDTEHEKSFKELRERIGAWDEMYRAIVAAKREKQLFKELRRKDERFLLREEIRRAIEARVSKIQGDIEAGQKIGHSQRWIDKHRFGFDRLIIVGERILKEPASEPGAEENPPVEAVPDTIEERKIFAFATRRPVTGEGDLTAWEMAQSERARAFKTLIGTDELNDFQARMKKDLRATGVADPGVRQRAALKALEVYMPGRIRQLAARPEYNFVITDEEIEKVFMEGLSLRKNLFVS